MAAKIRTSYITGQKLYALIWNIVYNKVWYQAGKVFETHGTSGRTNANYAISLSEVATGYYAGIWPYEIPNGSYDVVIKIQEGATPANSDHSVGGPVERTWNGIIIQEEGQETNAIDICNMALAKIGGAKNAQMIATLNPAGLTGDNKTTVEACELLYTPCRQETLKRIKPQECTYYADLGEESDYAGQKAEWEYCFDLPEDCLLFLRQTNERCHVLEYAHEVKQGRLFTNNLTNANGDSAYIEYVKNETDASVFPDEVVKAIATLLAAELCPRIIGGEWAWRRRQELLKEYETLVLPTSAGINRSVQHQYTDDELMNIHYDWLGGRF